MTERPNIILIHTDQQRGDCLGIDGHPVLETPNMDNLALNGARFNRFYSACPSCIAARRSLLWGQSPQKHGLVGFQSGMERGDSIPTLPQVLKENGYQTYLIGRDMHQHPRRKLYGFDDMELATGPQQQCFSEYKEWFEDNCPKGSRNQGIHGVGITHNDWTARPWHMDEYLHPSNWTVERTLRFFKRRDPTRPFFLSVGFMGPHPPLQPPQFYFDRYLRTGTPEPDIGDWCTMDWGDSRDHVSADKIVLNKEEMLTMRAAYYGAINHIDDLLRRIFNPVSANLNNTIVVFTSDHGEMLGDHYMFRKSRAYEASARVPFIMTAPDEFGVKRGAVIDNVASHHDIMPTLLDMLDIPIPDSVDGKSLYPLLKGEKLDSWRDCLHIEHAPYHQCVSDGKRKYIWEPISGKEYFFNLEKDPRELRNLVNDDSYAIELSKWRFKLIKCLKDRPEGFVKNNELVVVKDYGSVIPR